MSNQGYGPVSPLSMYPNRDSPSDNTWTAFISPSLFTSTAGVVAVAAAPRQGQGQQSHHQQGQYTHAKEINPFEESFAASPAPAAAAAAAAAVVDSTAIHTSSLEPTAASTRSSKRTAASAALHNTSDVPQQPRLIRTRSSTRGADQVKRPKLRLGTVAASESTNSGSTTSSNTNSIGSGSDDNGGRLGSSSSLATTVSPESSGAPSPKEQQQQSQSQSAQTTTAAVEAPSLLSQLVTAQQQSQAQAHSQRPGGPKGPGSGPAFLHYQPAPRPISLNSSGSSSSFQPPLPPSTMAASTVGLNGEVPMPPQSRGGYYGQQHGQMAMSTQGPPQHPAHMYHPQPQHQQQYPQQPSNMVAASSSIFHPQLPQHPAMTAAYGYQNNSTAAESQASSASTSRPIVVPSSVKSSTASSVTAPSTIDYSLYPALAPRKRGRKPKIPDPAAIILDPEVEKAAALERNRIAASKSRMRKKEKVKGLEQTAAELAAANAALQQTCHMLQLELTDLRRLLDAQHPQGCSCAHVQGYLAREAQGGGIPMIERLSQGTLRKEYGLAAGVDLGQGSHSWAEQGSYTDMDMDMDMGAGQSPTSMMNLEWNAAGSSSNAAPNKPARASRSSIYRRELDEDEEEQGNDSDVSEDHGDDAGDYSEATGRRQNEAARRNAIPIRRQSRAAARA